MADYEDYELPGYRYAYAAGNSDEDCFQIQEDDEPQIETRTKFHDLLGLDEEVVSYKAVPAPISKKPETLDDMPVKGAGKSFEQLIEEQMRSAGDAVPTQRRAIPKQSFLRKNSGVKAKTVIEKPSPAEEQPEDPPYAEEPQATAKPKQSFLKRGEGKICTKSQPEQKLPARPQASVPPAAKVTAPLKSTPAPAFPAQKQPAASNKPTAKPAAKRELSPAEDEIQICRDELITETACIRPRLKEKTLEIVDPKLDEKLNKLNYEIEQLKAKNKEDKEKVTKTEHQIAELDEELANFTEEKNERLSGIARWKEEEFRKIKAERRTIEAKLQPVAKRGDSEELEELKIAITRLQEELAASENKRKDTLDRIKATIITINTENRVLETELKEMEKRRVNEGWSKRRTADSRGRMRNGQY